MQTTLHKVLTPQGLKNLHGVYGVYLGLGNLRFYYIGTSDPLET